MPVAFYRIRTEVVRVYGMRPIDVERFCLALQEQTQHLHYRGQYRDPTGLLLNGFPPVLIKIPQNWHKFSHVRVKSKTIPASPTPF